MVGSRKFSHCFDAISSSKLKNQDHELVNARILKTLSSHTDFIWAEGVPLSFFTMP